MLATTVPAPTEAPLATRLVTVPAIGEPTLTDAVKPSVAVVSS